MGLFPRTYRDCVVKLSTPPNHNDVTNKWSCISCAPYTFMNCKHVTSAFTYNLQLLHNTCFSTWLCVCVCVYTWSTRLILLYAHTAAQIQHIVVCKTFTVDITTAWCLYFKLVILMCYFKIKLSCGFTKTELDLHYADFQWLDKYCG